MTYSVTVVDDLCKVTAVSMGIFEPLQVMEGGWYIINTTPDWFQRKLAVLSIADAAPTHQIDGVGRRMSDNTFWIEQGVDDETTV